MAPPLFPAGAIYALDVDDPQFCGNAPDGRVVLYRDNASAVATGYVWPVPLLVNAAVVTDQVSPIVAFTGRPWDCVGVYLQSISKTLPGELPPQLRIDLRVGWGTATTLAHSGVYNVATWGEAGLFFQWSGLLSARWEIWAGASADGPTRPAQEVRVQWAFLFARKGCCEPAVIEGPWVVEP